MIGIKVNKDDNYAYITLNFRHIIENDWLDDLKYICEPTEFHERRVTVSFITNIGVSREFNRHRVNSVAEESTRYCNYTKDKFGNEITITKPDWLNTVKYGQHLLDSMNKESVYNFSVDLVYNADLRGEWTDLHYYFTALKVAEYCYTGLLKCGWTAQQAREVLPLATKTQLVHTAFVSDWEHFFKLRAIGVSGAPHPNARAIAEPLYEEFIKRGYINKLD